MAERIYVSSSDTDQLHALIEWHSGGRDAVAAERLASELDRAMIVPPEDLPGDVVTMHSRVVFEDARSGLSREVVLVYPATADASAGRVSVLAPIGAALLGLRIGDTIEWPLPDDRTAKIRILAVTQPTAARETAA